MYQLQSPIYNLHEVQQEILRKLAQKPSLRFNEIKPDELDPRRFVFHLKKLQKLGLVSHNLKSGVYALTETGKFAQEYSECQVSDMPLFSFASIYVRKDNKILVVERESAPYLGYIGLPTFPVGGPKFMNSSAEDFVKGLRLGGSPILSLILELIYKGRKRKVGEHKFIFTYFLDDPEGEVIQKNSEGRFYWLSPAELLNIKKGYENTIDYVEHFERLDFDPGQIVHINRLYDTPN